MVPEPVAPGPVGTSVTVTTVPEGTSVADTTVPVGISVADTTVPVGTSVADTTVPEGTSVADTIVPLTEKPEGNALEPTVTVVPLTLIGLEDAQRVIGTSVTVTVTVFVGTVTNVVKEKTMADALPA
ncbi:hypothetical protein PHLCEN_2v6898 [Hermanssonia centrifuga]|uniref:Uncharacterized protein n=1 Tax=Hermanssonia centrifuga TaxID=98765 RepID=A0A2R6NY61_9APHY|nr:hypothetical protein PHLCEN_2v6898 [Hermanssonia centrifuga]